MIDRTELVVCLTLESARYLPHYISLKKKNLNRGLSSLWLMDALALPRQDMLSRSPISSSILSTRDWGLWSLHIWPQHNLLTLNSCHAHWRTKGHRNRHWIQQHLSHSYRTRVNSTNLCLCSIEKFLSKCIWRDEFASCSSRMCFRILRSNFLSFLANVFKTLLCL